MQYTWTISVTVTVTSVKYPRDHNMQACVNTISILDTWTIYLKYIATKWNSTPCIMINLFCINLHNYVSTWEQSSSYLRCLQAVDSCLCSRIHELYTDEVFTWKGWKFDTVNRQENDDRQMKSMKCHVCGWTNLQGVYQTANQWILRRCQGVVGVLILTIEYPS